MKGILKNIRKNNVTIAKKIVPVIIVFAMLSLSVITVFACVNTVDIVDGENITRVRTIKGTPAEILAENNIIVKDNDVVTQDGDSIIIKRALPVFITVAGEKRYFQTTEKNVEQVLSAAGIEILENDEISPALGTPVTEHMEITVSRTITDTVVEEAEIPFETKTVKTAALAAGEKKVKTEGEKGTKTLTYEVAYKDGQEISRELISENITKQPQTEVVEVGEQEARPVNTSTQVSRGGNIRSSKTIHVSATAYDIKGRTATGVMTRPGIVAVDPRVIPLGTRMYITSPDGSYVYGYAIAADTGGAIKGNTIDLYFETRAECINFGRRNMVVHILD